MDLQTSHLAAALMSGTTYNSPILEPLPASVPSSDESKMKPPEPQKELMDEDKEEIASGEEFSDEEAEAQAGSKSMPGRGVTLQMLLEEKMLEPGNAAMTIEYLGQKFVGDLQADGKIKSHETETIFCSPSAWAIHCKRIINPDKRSGCGWASVKYRGKKLDTIKATYLRKKQIQRDNMHSDEETEMEVESPPEPPPQRIVMKHNTVPNRMMQHDSNMLIEAVSFSSAGKVQPFMVSMSSNASLVLDIHCHLKKEEVYGYLAGAWDLTTHNLMITHTFPCLVSKNDSRPRVMVELEIQMEIEKLGLTLLGWYHSHPTNPAMPSLRDCDNQLEYQIKMRGPSEVSYVPCIGVICSPYNPESPVLESSLTFFWVMPPPEQRPTEYPRPLLLQYNMAHDSHLSHHAMEQIKKSIKYYSSFVDETFIDFKESFKPDITFLDKLKCTLTTKFPREQSDGLLWHFIKGELGCSSEHDDKMDLDALLAVPQPIPVSKPTPPTSVPSFPSVSTLQQMVSRPAGVPPINVSSAIGSGSPHKFETPQLNIPVLPTSKSSTSKSATPTLPPSYPTGLDMLTSMALGLGTGNMSMSLGTSGLESLAAANSMLSGLTPGLSSSLTASLTGSKLPDPPSYAASLQNLTNSLGSSFDKTPSSTSTSTPSTPIPANIASNLMMSSADIANALFSATKYSNAGILGIPDPMSKSTLAANNMFLSPSLIKMQESLMKPLSSSSPISSKVGLDQSALMKSPHELLKGSKDFGKDYSKEYGKDYNKDYGKDYNKEYNKDYNKEYNKDYNKEYNKDYNKEYNKEYNKDYNKDYGKDYTNKEYNKDYSKEYGKDFAKEYGKDFAKEYGKDYAKEYGKDYAKEYGKDYSKEYAKDYAKEYGKDYSKDYAKEYGKDYAKEYGKDYSKDYSKEYLPPDFGSIGKGKPEISTVKPMELSDPALTSKAETSKSEPMDTQATDFSMPPRVGGESFLNQMMELTKKTTMPDYMPDYSRPEHQPIKLSKAEELAASMSASSHAYLNSGGIVDTITQVAMGNFSKQDQPLDYGKEQDYSKHKTSENDK